MQQNPPEQSAPRDEVTAAFEAARKGHFDQVATLDRLGKPIVPLLAPYVEDPNPDVRREAVRLLKQIGGREALPLLVTALGDTDREIQELAAAGLFRHTPMSDVTATPGAEDRARASVAAGNHTAAAILLLGRFSGAESEKLLRSLRSENPDQLSKLHPWSAAVPVAIPALVALSQRGDNDARQELIRTIGRDDLKVLEFLLSVLREIDAPEVIHALKNVALTDERLTTAGVPSGAEAELRVCDLAVTAFVRGLDLDVDFKVSDSENYTPEQIEAVRRAIDKSLPK